MILGFDTSAAHCAVALLRDGDIIAARGEDMHKGQAERLMPLIGEIMAEQGVTYADLTRIGVGVGPGNFTGIRISVAAARGLSLSLSLKIPAIGVSSFQAIHHGAPGATAAVPAPRGMAWRQTGTAAPVLESARPGDMPPPCAAELASAIARIAAIADPSGPPPVPLYLRPADAAPPRDAPPVIVDAF